MTLTANRPVVMTEPVETVGAVCFHAVIRALQFAAVRSKATGRSNGRELGTPPHLVYTRVTVPVEDRLLAGAWDCLDLVLTDDCSALAAVCDGYVRDLLVSQREPSRVELTELIREALVGQG